jgi:hypothetical protein
MAIKFERTNPKISEEELAEFEKSHNTKLPEDYRQFLLETNGGVPSLENAYIPYILYDGTDSFYTVEDFFGIKQADKSNDLTWVNWLLNQEDSTGRKTIPPNCLAIASIMGGHDYLGISFVPNTYGYIYVWDNHNADYENAWKVAESFSEFLTVLCHPED